MWTHLATELQLGNPYVIAMMALGFFGLTILIERFIMLQFVYSIDFKKFINSLKTSVLAEDIDRALQVCTRTSSTSLPLISKKALEAAEKDPSTVKGTIEEETVFFLPQIERRLSTLPTLSTMILLLGILATIDGLWSAFDSIVILDTAQKQARLSNGIAGSLNPTATGLLICMVFLAGNQVLRSLANRVVDQTQYGVTILQNLLVPQEVATIGAPVVAAAPAPVAPVAPAPLAAVPNEEDEELMGDASLADADDDVMDDPGPVEEIKDEEEII